MSTTTNNAIPEAKAPVFKRLLSDVSDEGESCTMKTNTTNNKKRQRVHHDAALLSLGSQEELAEVEEDDNIDFVVTIGEDGDWDIDYKIDNDHHHQPPSSLPPHQAEQEVKEEHQEHEELLLRVDSNGSLGNNLKISIKKCNNDEESTTEVLGVASPPPANLDADAAISISMIPIPLITPPSSPRRIRTMSVDGLTSEETTICEWPCNLTVDNAMLTAALESSSDYANLFL